jgi:hypothetical protein
LFELKREQEVFDDSDEEVFVLLDIDDVIDRGGVGIRDNDDVDVEEEVDEEEEDDGDLSSTAADDAEEDEANTDDDEDDGDISSELDKTLLFIDRLSI